MGSSLVRRSRSEIELIRSERGNSMLTMILLFLAPVGSILLYLNVSQQLAYSTQLQKSKRSISELEKKIRFKLGSRSLCSTSLSGINVRSSRPLSLARIYPLSTTTPTSTLSATSTTLSDLTIKKVQFENVAENPAMAAGGQGSFQGDLAVTVYPNGRPNLEQTLHLPLYMVGSMGNPNKINRCWVTRRDSQTNKTLEDKVCELVDSGSSSCPLHYVPMPDGNDTCAPKC